MRKYNQRPEVKERRREYARGYYHRPEVKERMLEYARKYNQRPEVKERRREYMREYWQRPEVKERQRERKREQRLNKLREEEWFQLDEETTRRQFTLEATRNESSVSKYQERY